MFHRPTRPLFLVLDASVKVELEGVGSLWSSRDAVVGWAALGSSSAAEMAEMVVVVEETKERGDDAVEEQALSDRVSLRETSENDDPSDEIESELLDGELIGDENRAQLAADGEAIETSPVMTMRAAWIGSEGSLRTESSDSERIMTGARATSFSGAASLVERERDRDMAR